MSIAGIEKIREAETSADLLKKTSEEDAARIIADGRKKAKMLLEEAEKEGHIEYQKVMEKAEKDAAILYDTRLNEEQVSCEKLKEVARKNIPLAVETIVGKVVSTYGNS